MRLAHFSDLHYGPRNLAEADRCFSAAVECAIELRVDAAVVTGDATDHALDLHSPAAQRLAQRIRQLAEPCPVLMHMARQIGDPGLPALLRRVSDLRNDDTPVEEFAKAIGEIQQNAGGIVSAFLADIDARVAAGEIDPYAIPRQDDAA